MSQPNVLSEPLFTAHQIAAALPNRTGKPGIHVQTLLRRVEAGDFPEPDVKYRDGTRLWKQSTLRRFGL